jgi:hypothetical protein
VLIRNRDTGRYFVLLVERGSKSQFDIYCNQENLTVIAWLDSTAALDRLAAQMAA